MRVDAPTLATRPFADSSSRVAASAPSMAADLRTLLKPGISLFVTVVAFAAYLLGSPEALHGPTLLALLVGTALASGGGAALNHLVERGPDSLMQRTKNRPLPTGRLSPGFALGYGLLTAGIGLGLLYVYTNPLTASLALATVVLYVAVYTPMKRRSSWNTFVGAVPGALPALGGWAAATGSLDAGGWALFALLFLWQLPHFYALAWMFREDYARGGFRMLSVTRPDGRLLAYTALGATLVLLVVGVLPTALQIAGWFYLGGMLILGVAFTLPAFAFASEPTHARARRLLLASIVYLPAFFTLVVLDYLIR